MSAFLIVQTKVNDPDKFQTYASSSGSTVAAFGGEFIVKGRKVTTIIGEHNDSQTAAVIKFPDQAAIKAWYHSDDYQALIPNRDAAADMTFTTYDEPPA